MTLDKYIYDLYPYAFMRTRNLQNTEDILQDLALKVFSRKEYFDNKTEIEIRKILITALKRMLIDKWRRKIPVIESDIDFKNLFSVQNDVWEKMMNNDIKKAFKTVLTEKQRVCFRLRMDGYNYKEIAKQINTDTNSVGQHIKKAKNNLKKYETNNSYQFATSRT